MKKKNTDNLIEDGLTTSSNLWSAQKVQTEIDTAIAGVLTHKGGYDASTDTPSLDDGTPIAGIVTGDAYVVTVAGSFFTATVEPGDVLIADQDAPTLESHWTIVQANLTPATIKTQYESNADTNAFTDAEQTKLAGIEANAKDDQNAAEVSYSNATSGLAATDVQAAIDEVEARVDTLEAVVPDVCAIYDATGTPTYYSTLQAAITAASAGETVQLLTDITETGAVQVALKNGVNINGNGHTYELDNVTASLNTFWDNNVAVTCKISNIKLVRTSGTGDVLDINNSSTKITLDGVILESSSGNGLDSDSSVYGNFIVNITGTGIGVNLVAGVSIENFTITTQNGIGLSVAGGSGRITNGKIYSSGAAAAFGGFIGTNVEFRSAGSYAYQASGANCIMRNCVFESSSTYAARGGGDYYNCTFRSTAGTGFYGLSGGNLMNCSLESTTSNAASLNSGNRLINCFLKSSSLATISSQGTTVLIANCSIVCNYNNSAGAGIKFTSTALTVSNCSFEITNSSAYALDESAGGSLACEYTGCKVKGGAGVASATTLQTITNTEDNYGNILI